MQSYGGFLVFLSTIITPSLAQIDGVSTSGFVAVMAVCGGTVIILIIIWIGICCSLYSTERDYCNFKKRLREYRRNRELVIQQQLERRGYTQLNRRNRSRRGNVQISAPIQTVDGARMRVDNLPRVLPHPPPIPESSSQPQDSSTEPNPPSMPTTPSREETQAESPLTPVEQARNQTVIDTTTLATYEAKKSEKKKSVHFNEDHNTIISGQSSKIKTSKSKINKTEHNNSRQEEVLSYSEEAVDDSGHSHMKCLGEEEEIDVKVDKNSFQPRYSWISPAKKFRISAPSSAVQKERDRVRFYGTTQEMAAFGQLHTWPQLKL